VVGLLVLGVIGSILQLVLLNLALKTYRQVEVIPVYESLVTIMIVVSGLVLFDESEFYGWARLVGIFFSIVLVCFGICVLALKDNIKAKIEKKN
jgi:multidrug transporter EmrE-like cation transporter